MNTKLSVLLFFLCSLTLNATNEGKNSDADLKPVDEKITKGDDIEIPSIEIPKTTIADNIKDAIKKIKTSLASGKSEEEATQGILLPTDLKQRIIKELKENKEIADIVVIIQNQLRKPEGSIN